MQFIRFALAALSVKVVSAAASPDALPWAQANPHANAAANAFADAYAEAVAIAHPDPEAYAMAASADDCATIACHAACGLLIIYGSDCTFNTENQYAGPYNTTCLCSDDSDFVKQYPTCMNCGWTLWKYYGGYVSSALAACGTLSTEPTGTLRCSTTLTDSYVIDTGLQACEYTGGCTTTAEEATTTAETTTSTSAVTTSTTAQVTSTTAAGVSTTAVVETTSTSAATTETTSTTAETSAAAGQTTETQPDSTTTTFDATAPITTTNAAGEATTITPITIEATSVAETVAPVTTTNELGETTVVTPTSAAQTVAPVTTTNELGETTVITPISIESTSAEETTGYFNSTSTVTQNEQSSTIITITSCSDNACSEVPVTTGVTVITATNNGVVTEYTTYCPLTSASTEAPAATTTETPEVASTQSPATTVATIEATSSVAIVTTFEGKAVVMGTSVLGLVLSFLLF